MPLAVRHPLAIRPANRRRHGPGAASFVPVRHDLAQSVKRVSMATLEQSTGSETVSAEGDGVRRRDFLSVAAVSAAGVGAVAAIAPLVVQMNPSADVLALAQTEVDISKIAPGQAIKTVWRKQPVFVRN